MKVCSREAHCWVLNVLTIKEIDSVKGVRVPGNMKLLLQLVLCAWHFIIVSTVFSSQEQELSAGKITITAGKTKSFSDDFPGSISVKDEYFFDDHVIRDLGELTRFIPNVYCKKATSGDSFVARGISTIDTSFYSPMGLYINDVAYPLSYMQDQHVFDIQRVEVLRGPQATLYGRNSESGIINMVLAEPDNEIKVKTVLETGNYGTYSGNASIRGPVVKDTLYLGLSVSASQTDGYMENELTQNDKAAEKTIFSSRGTLRWTPAPGMNISFFLDTSDKDLGVSFLRFEDGPHFSDRLKVKSSEKDRADEDDSGQALRVSWRFKEFDVTSITARRCFDRDFIHDFDRTPLKLGFVKMDLDQESFSQEFRFASSGEARLSWIVGLYAGKETLDTKRVLAHENTSMANNRATDSENDGYAVFGQSSFPMNEKIKITAGLRLDHSSASADQIYKNDLESKQYDDGFSDTKLLPMVSVSCRFNNNINTYVTFSTGWLMGGFNHFSAISPDTFFYGPEYTDNYEIGFKTAFLNNRLKADCAFFYTDIDDKQIREEVPGGGTGVWKFTNAAKAHTKGFEFEITALPVSCLELFAGIGYAATQIDQWTGAAGGLSVDYSGNALPWSPELTYNAGIGYYMNNGLYCMADVFCAGKQYFDAENTLKDNGYALVNIKTGYKYKNFDVSIFCKNLFDEAYVNKKVKTRAGHTLVEDGEPFTFGFTFNWSI